MAAYYKVDVVLNSQAVQVGLPSPQSVRVTLPLRGPQGLQGIQGEVGPIGPVGQTGSPGADGREVELQTTETHVQWRYEGESEWIDLVALSAITGPQGIQGETGLTGAAGADGREVELRKTETHVQWRYEDEAEYTDLIALSEITGPQGETGQQGPAGPANTLAIGTVTTGAAGSSADATLTGDSPAQTLNLVIPRGDKGDQGDQGPAGTATTDASDLTTGTLADARLSSNVPLKDAANTFSANQTFSGTNNVMPNQTTAASGSSIMTRDLVAQRSWDLSQTPRIIEIQHFGFESVGGTGVRSISVRGNVINFFANTAGGVAVRNATNAIFGYMLMLGNTSNGEGGYFGADFDRDILWRIPLASMASPAGAAGIIRIGTHGQFSTAATRIERNGWQIRWQFTGGSAAVRFCRMIAPTIANGRTITGATNASPIVLTFSGAHGLVNGDQIEVGEVGGNTDANGIWTVDNVTSTTCELVGSTGNAAYTSGGAAHHISNEVYTHAASTNQIYYVRSNAGTMTLTVNDPNGTALASGAGPTGRRNIGFFSCVEATATADFGFNGHPAGPFTVAIR
jgi:hypothetical protein